MSNKIQKECRFAVFIPPAEYGQSDYHLVKEVIHEPNGKTYPKVHFIKDFKIPFWVTKKGLRNHEQKKEGEWIANVVEYKTTASRLVSDASKALGMPWFKKGLRELNNNPYLYGTDILSTTLIKNAYRQKYPGLDTMHTSAFLDTESNVFSPKNETIISNIAYKLPDGRVAIDLAIDASFLKGIPRPEEKILNSAKVLLKEYIDRYKITDDLININIVNNEAEVFISNLKFAHEHKPDFIGIWNIGFDISQMEKAFARCDLDIAQFASDPAVPENLRFFKYVEGSKKLKTASGKVKPKDSASQWNVVKCPASFYFVDAMSVYKQIRTPPKPEEPSYALDAILNKELNIGKLKFDQVKNPGTLEWHKEMQANYKIEYVVYNLFDTLALIVLEEKTKDLAMTLPVFCGDSDYASFGSQPTKNSDKQFFHFLERGMVFGSSGSEMKSELDDKILQLSNWIVALPSFLRNDIGLKCIAEDPTMSTNIYVNCADLDVAAAYPTNEEVFNVSKMTTKREIINVEGIPEAVFRAQGINLSSGPVNFLEYTQKMFGFPELNELRQIYRKEKGLD